VIYEKLLFVGAMLGAVLPAQVNVEWLLKVKLQTLVFEEMAVSYGSGELSDDWPVSGIGIQ
jgi:hypothetical protein